MAVDKEANSLSRVYSYYSKFILLKDDKTEVILFTSKHALKSHPSVAITVDEQPYDPQQSSVTWEWFTINHYRLSKREFGVQVLYRCMRIEHSVNRAL